MSTSSISRSVTLTFRYSISGFYCNRQIHAYWALLRRQLLSRFYRNRKQKWRLLQQVILSTTVCQAIISSIPASSMIFAIEAGMPASVMITSTRSRLHIRPKPLYQTLTSRPGWWFLTKRPSYACSTEPLQYLNWWYRFQDRYRPHPEII